ncbi:TetR/AcrR family transcriptional regulator [Kytococcus sedentarius]|uniref:TetR/AcrR family transcriptional regulator n=1 Tax=Kytococcus sedentarius TaxID=1276 RepID=UPI003879DC32
MPRCSRPEMEAAILAAGRRQLQQKGAAALSLREVAREVGVVSSAVYRYVSSRDELLTRLLVAAFDGLADAVDAALADAPGREPLAVIAYAVRRWAVEHPEEWGLVYGTPVPGYAAPQERTGGPGTRVLAWVLRAVVDAVNPASGVAPGGPPAGPVAEFAAEATDSLQVSATPDQMAMAMGWWAGLVGLVHAEVFGFWGPVPDGLGEQLLDHWLSGPGHPAGTPGGPSPR